MNIETIVVGGGQAGLSASWHLKKAGREHMVLDRGNVGDTWRKRWDSFCLVTPNWTCRLPGFPYPGDEPNGFMQRDEIVEYVEEFARSFGPPIRNGVDVEKIAAGRDDTFVLKTSDGNMTAQNLIVATGTHQHPKIPDLAKRLPRGVLSVHTAHYHAASDLPDGAVLVVGSGQSGCQVVEDLRIAGGQVHLCVGSAGRIPRRYRGRDIIEWDRDTGFFDLAVDDHPLGTDIRFKAHPHLSGRNGGYTIDLRALGRDGVTLHGRLVNFDGQHAVFADDLLKNLDAADAFCRRNTADIDDFIDATGQSAPAPDLTTIDWDPPNLEPMLDLTSAGISTIIFATGFYRNFDWIDLPVFDDQGYPRYQRGVTDLPGLYFVGLHWMHTQGSGLFYGVGDDAEYVVDHLIEYSG